MIALVLGLVVGAVGSTEVEGAVTAGGSMMSRAGGGGGIALVHARVDLSRDFGRAFVEGRASLLVHGGVSGVGFSDLGSRLTLGYRPGGFVKRVALEVLPFNATTRLPSFDWANAWGLPPLGDVFVPVLTGEIATQAGSLFVSGRFKTVLNNLINLNEVRPDLFVGVELPLASGLQLELRGAYLDSGINPMLAQQGLRVPLHAAGGGARLTWTWNEPVGPATDLVTYADDPLRFERFFQSEPRRSPFAAWLALEGGGAAQQLADLEVPQASKAQAMGWVDLQARLRLRELRLFATARVQSVTLALFDVKGVPPSFALASGRVTAPRVAAFVGADWRIRALKLTPGVLFILTQPGWIREPDFNFGNTNRPPGFSGPRTLFVRGPGVYGIVAADRQVAPFLNMKVSARWEALSFASIVGEVDVEKDLNDYRLPDGDVNIFGTGEGDQLTVRGQLYLQARF